MASPSAQEFVAALRRVEEEGDVEAMAAVAADDARLANPTDRTPHRGPDGARRFWGAYRKSFESIRSHFHAVLESDTRIMLEWTSDCRTAAGVNTAYDGVSVVETQGGKIVRFNAYFDPMALSAHVPLSAMASAPLADAPPQDEGGVRGPSDRGGQPDQQAHAGTSAPTNTQPNA